LSVHPALEVRIFLDSPRGGVEQVSEQLSLHYSGGTGANLSRSRPSRLSGLSQKAERFTSHHCDQHRSGCAAKCASHQAHCLRSDEAIRTLAQSLTAKAGGDLDKLRILHDWVAQHIRYLGVYVGAGGFVPRKATEIFATRYGDCKDHVALLEAMLRAVGIESSPALINLGDAYGLPELAVSNPINHVITYVPSLDLYVDSTAQFAAVGTLPSEDSNKPVIITATGELKRTPPQAPTRDGGSCVKPHGDAFRWPHQRGKHDALQRKLCD